MIATGHLNDILSQVTKSDLREEFRRLAKDPARLESEISDMAESLSKKDVLEAIGSLGGADKLVEKLFFFIAYKGALVRKGIKLGVAGGAAAALCFGGGALGHRIAESTGSTSLEDFACDLDAIGQHASEISNVGFEFAHQSIDFFQDATETLQSILS